MAIGNTVQQAGLNVALGNAAVSIRDACLVASELWAYIITLGANEAAQVAGLEALGFTATDAQNFWTAANQCFTIQQIYTGAIPQPAAFNFDSALAIARGAS
jgi:hypothetical protein